MPERLKQIIDKIGDWWKRFSTKQKTLIVSIAAVVVVALIILGMVVSRPTMVTLITCDSATQASQVKDLLDGESIPYELSQDGLTFTVNKKDEANASILLGSTVPRPKGTVLMMRSTEASVLRKRIRLRNTSFIWKAHLRIDWRQFQT